MRIAILAHNLRVAGGLSVGRNVIAALRHVGDEHEYLLTLPAGVGYEDQERPTRATCHFYARRFGPAGQALFDLVGAPRRVRRFAPDVVWALGNHGLTRPRAPQALLCHMPHLWYDPQEQPRQIWRPDRDLYYVKWRLRRCLPATQLVFLQTQTAAERFRRTFAYTGRTALMPNAVSRYVGGAADADMPAPLAALRSRFVLFCLTRYYPHKNLEALAELFRRHHAELADVVIVLTLAPDDSAASAGFVAQLAEPVLRDHLVNVGPLPQAQLAGYFRHCRALILPTVLESFSGTYLEAMQFGTPILTSDLDFARETCGDAAAYFDPWNVDSIKDAILRLKNEPGLSATLIERGRQRAESMFRSWDDIVAAALRELLSLCGPL